MRISGGGGASSHHESTHSNSRPSHSAVSHHEAPARSAPARSAPARRENTAPTHHSEPARDTVHISPQAARLERLMSSQDKITQSSSKPAPQPAKKESSGGFWSKLVDKVSNVAQKVEQTTKKVEQAVSKEAGHVEQAAKQVAHEAEQSTKAVLQEAKHAETKVANVLHQTAHEAEKVAQKAENTVSKNAHKIASRVEQEAEKAGRTLQKDAKEIASKVNKETEKIGHSAVTRLKNAEHTVSQGLKAAEQRERKIANGIAKDVQSVEQKVQSGAKHLENRVIQAYQATQQAVGQAVGDVQHSVHQVRQEADKIESNMEKGARNLAAHPGATVSATMSVVGGAAEAVAGVTFAAATSETCIGAVAGAAVAIDGGAHAVAGLGDLASIFNGDISKLGTHNILENMAGRIGGQTGRNIYNAASTTVGLVIPGSDVNSAREVLTSVSSHTKGLLSTAKKFVTNAIPSGQFRPVYAVDSAFIGGHIRFEPVRMESSTEVTMAKALESPGGVAGKGTGKVGDDFVGTLKGEGVHLKGVKTKEIIYTKRLPEETAKLRKEFDNTVRKNYLEELVNDPVKNEQLRKAGLTDNDISRMKDGLVPKGWQVHHKLPLDHNGGTNAFDNLILIKNDPYHKAITNAQNDLTRGLSSGESKTINWPIPNGDIYPPEKDR